MREQNQPKPAAFIDRDGTLIEEVNYLSDISGLNLFRFTNEAVSLLKENGYLVIVATNQSGIGRNIYDETAMHAIHDEIQKRLSIPVDAFYFCPHLPCDGCHCRKPNLGMLEAAISDFDIDIENSWMIGDKKIDIETGFNAGIKTALVSTGYGKLHASELDRQPDIVAEDLLAAVKFLVGRS